MKAIERAARTCYKSEDRITEGSARELVSRLIRSGHHAMLEFGIIQVRFICNRGFTHELVRHRLCSFAQESTRYCNYSKDNHGNEVTFIIPPWLENADSSMRDTWKGHMKDCEDLYLSAIKNGLPPQHARGFLPIDLKTEIVIQANLREWRHIFKLRTAPAAHPSMQQLMIPLLDQLRGMIPILFEDV